ncbi:MAG TPA: hypothetical protein VGM52_05135 [Herbaspirillum sp.]|jgi:hypothetical protein
MAHSSLDPDLIKGSDRQLGRGHDKETLGPGDSSDSGSDFAGLSAAGDDSDSNGTGERASVNQQTDRLQGDIDDDDIEATDVGDDFAENDEIDPDIGVDPDEMAPSVDEEIRDLNLDIDEIEND